MCIRPHVTYSSFLSDFKDTLTFSSDFRKVLKYETMKIRPVGAELFRAGRHRKNMKVIVAFRNFVKKPKTRN